jgi:hypothetical protein
VLGDTILIDKAINIISKIIATGNAAVHPQLINKAGTAINKSGTINLNINL